MKKTVRHSKRIKPQTSQNDFLKIIDQYGFEQGVKLVYTFGKMFSNNVPLKNMIAAGNIKIPKETAIFNMSSATDCPSLKLNICKACVFNNNTQKEETVCYALKAERQYPDVLPYRKRQNAFWLYTSPEEFVKQFLIINSHKRNKFNKIRFNEAGDFHTNKCIKKADKIAKLLKPFGITCYTYTSRDDLDFSKVKHIVINGSSFKKTGVKNEFKMVRHNEKPPKGYAKCPQDCTICDRCSIPNKNTYSLQH
jgi:hypothetical protein